MNNRNDSTALNATGVLAPFIRCATHIGWCIGYLGTIEGNELSDTEQRHIIEDLGDALRHIDEPETTNLLDAFIGNAGLETLRLMRQDLSEPIMSVNKDEVHQMLQVLADNAAHSGAVLERLMTGNESAQAGRNL